MASDQKPEIGSTADANGIKTNYLEEGKGDAVILIHGSASSPVSRSRTPRCSQPRGSAGLRPCARPRTTSADSGTGR